MVSKKILSVIGITIFVVGSTTQFCSAVCNYHTYCDIHPNIGDLDSADANYSSGGGSYYKKVTTVEVGGSGSGHILIEIECRIINRDQDSPPVSISASLDAGVRQCIAAQSSPCTDVCPYYNVQHCIDHYYYIQNYTIDPKEGFAEVDIKTKDMYQSLWLNGSTTYFVYADYPIDNTPLTNVQHYYDYSPEEYRENINNNGWQTSSVDISSHSSTHTVFHESNFDWLDADDDIEVYAYAQSYVSVYNEEYKYVQGQIKLNLYAQAKYSSSYCD